MTLLWQVDWASSRAESPEPATKKPDEILAPPSTRPLSHISQFCDPIFNAQQINAGRQQNIGIGRWSRLQLLIPYFLRRDHGGKKRGVFRFRFDIDEIFAVDGDPPEYLPDQGLPLLVSHPRRSLAGWLGAGCCPVLRPHPQLPYDFSVLGSQFPLDFSLLGPRLFLNFPPTFLIFSGSSARLYLEKVDSFSGFSRGEVVK